MYRDCSKKPTLQWAAILAAAVIGVIGPAGESRASQPCRCAHTWTLPPDSASGVPLNARILVFHPKASQAFIRLYLASGSKAEVAATVQAADGYVRGYWLIPNHPLLPSTGYRLTYAGETASFSTGTGNDTTAPTLSGVTMYPSGGGACGDHLAAALETIGLKDDQTSPHQMVARAVVSNPAGDKETVYVPLNTAGVDPNVGGYLGWGTDWEVCFPPYTAANSRDTFNATVAVIDWAGNISKTVGPVSFKFGETLAPGCSMGRGPVSPLPAAPLLLLACLLLLRRIRRLRLGVTIEAVPQEPS